jgi:hypothetical protein
VSIKPVFFIFCHIILSVYSYNILLLEACQACCLSLAA